MHLLWLGNGAEVVAALWEAGPERPVASHLTPKNCLSLGGTHLLHQMKEIGLKKHK